MHGITARHTAKMHVDVVILIALHLARAPVKHRQIIHYNLVTPLPRWISVVSSSLNNSRAAYGLTPFFQSENAPGVYCFSVPAPKLCESELFTLG
jgi:hypothetical protein